jgi:RHS repeat-associated protein
MGCLRLEPTEEKSTVLRCIWRRGDSTKSGVDRYDYGARFYDPQIGRWHAVDPMADVAPDWSPYRFCFNNPIKIVDPTGLLETEFVDIETGERTNIDDGKDQVIAGTTATIKAMKNSFKTNRDQYNSSLESLESSEGNLNMTSGEFSKLVESVYAESSGEFGETMGIVNVLQNRAAQQGTSLMDQVTAKSPYGVYGTLDRDRYGTEEGALADNKRATVNSAVAIGLILGTDITNGAMFWDGTDIKTNSHYKQWGLTFSSSTHNLWGQKNTTGKAQLISTAAYGKTIFSKFQNQGSKWFISK